jgi:hypothetical protein
MYVPLLGTSTPKPSLCEGPGLTRQPHYLALRFLPRKARHGDGLAVSIGCLWCLSRAQETWRAVGAMLRPGRWSHSDAQDPLCHSRRRMWALRLRCPVLCYLFPYTAHESGPTLEQASREGEIYHHRWSAIFQGLRRQGSEFSFSSLFFFLPSVPPFLPLLRARSSGFSCSLVVAPASDVGRSTRAAILAPASLSPFLRPTDQTSFSQFFFYNPSIFYKRPPASCCSSGNLRPSACELCPLSA